jgi:hypothetical protein
MHVEEREKKKILAHGTVGPRSRVCARKNSKFPPPFNPQQMLTRQNIYSPPKKRNKMGGGDTPQTNF